MIQIAAMGASAWRVSHQKTIDLLMAIPDEALDEKLALSSWTVGQAFSHLHNTRVAWTENIGAVTHLSSRIATNAATKDDLLIAFETSADAIGAAIEWAILHAKKIPGFRGTVIEFLVYLCSHEAHHRGQIILGLKGVGRALPPAVKRALWNW